MSESLVHLLVIEDDVVDVDILLEQLDEFKHEFVIDVANRLSEAFLLIAQTSFDVVLLDLSLPDSHSVDTVTQLLSHVPNIPIIVLSGLDDQNIAMEAVRNGAQDYLVKGKTSPDVILRVIRYAIERKKVEQLHQRLSLLEERETYVAMLAHDLRIPLIGANRILSILAESSGSDKKQAQLLSQIVKSNTSLLQMISNVLDVYKHETDPQEMRLETVDITNLIEQCIALVGPVSDRRDLRVRTPAEPVHVHANPIAMHRVITNLLNNAIKYTEDGDEIDVSLEQLKDQVVIRVRDSGIGMTPEQQKHVFQRFFQAHDRYRAMGLGLGLHLCQQFMVAQKGTISFTSQFGTGTTFELTLPSCATATRPKVLIVDDVELMQIVLKKFLAEIEVDSDVVSCGTEAVQAASSYAYSAIFMDLCMPDMDGYATTQALRANGVNIPIFSYSAQYNQVSTAGFDDACLKPINFTSLSHLVGKWIRPSASVSG